MLNKDEKSVLQGAILYMMMSDIIKGFSLDILVPVLESIVPGSLDKPVNIAGQDFHLKRFMVRLINVILAIIIYRKLKQNG